VAKSCTTDAISANVTGDVVLNRLMRGQLIRECDLSFRLPSPPDNVRLDDLGFDTRTLNALKRHGFDGAPWSLAETTVGEVLHLPGFGRHCLKNYLLTSAEWVKTPQHDSTRAIISYLDDLLDAARTTPLNQILHKRLLSPPPDVALKDLNLATRTINCLRAAKITPRKLRSLGKYNVGMLLSLEHFGRSSLLDLLTALRRAYQCCGPPAHANNTQRGTTASEYLDYLLSHTNDGLVSSIRDERPAARL